ncbi:MAG: PDZ domain-containing protein [Blastocatellia bacterium]|jgi:C-terminal processing protease CtpA/Prc
MKTINLTLLLLLMAASGTLAEPSAVMVPGREDQGRVVVRPQTGDGLSGNQGTWGFLGVYLGDLTADRARELGLQAALSDMLGADTHGVIVGMVEKGSPAAKVGLRENDCLLTLDGQPIVNRLQFFQSMMIGPPGRKIRLGVLRGTEPLIIEVELGTRLSPAMEQRKRLFNESDALLRSAEDNRRMAEEAQAKGDARLADSYRENEKTLIRMAGESRAYVEKEIREGRISEPAAVQSFNLNMALSAKRYLLGVTTAAISPQLAAYFNVEAGALLVTEVRVGGAAGMAGLKAGDCIVKFNNESITGQTDFNRLFDQAMVGATTSGGPAELTLLVVRDRVAQVFRIRI